MVGVLRDARQWGWSDPQLERNVHPVPAGSELPARPRCLPTMMLVVTHGARLPAGSARPIREHFGRSIRTCPVTAIQNMEQVVDDAVWQQRMEMSVLTGFAVAGAGAGDGGDLCGDVVRGGRAHAGDRHPHGAGRGSARRPQDGVGAMLRPVVVGWPRCAGRRASRG